MDTPFIAGIVLFAGNFSPRGWAFCQGQILPIAQYTALFSLLGTTFGGNGQTTFALPDLRGRVPIHPGQGPGLSNYILGQQGGTETHTLTIDEMPAHNHTVGAHGGGKGSATTDDPTNAVPGDTNANIYVVANPTITMRANMIGTTGGGQAFSIVQPYLAINYIIALEGIFPVRN